jgi:Flp pilus assembly protein TadB
MTRETPGALRALGWVLAGLFGVIILVEMVVLAVMAAFIMLPLAAVPVAVVALAAALIIWDTRRRLRR